MRRAAFLTVLASVAGGCVSMPADEPRGGLIRHLLSSAVQLRSEQEGGGRRAASGIVVAADPGTRQSWILTVGHFAASHPPQRISVLAVGASRWEPARILASSREPDLAVLVVEGVALPPATVRREAALGDTVWVIAYPWGRRVTVVRGVVSQIDTPESGAVIVGAPRLVDASVSYGASGGGVFDAQTGELIALVEGYRTARISAPRDPTATVEVPVPGETNVIPGEVIISFLTSAGLKARVGVSSRPRSDTPTSR